jgi:hypothetical protein
VWPFRLAFGVPEDAGLICLFGFGLIHPWMTLFAVLRPGIGVMSNRVFVRQDACSIGLFCLSLPTCLALHDQYYNITGVAAIEKASGKSRLKILFRLLVNCSTHTV